MHVSGCARLVLGAAVFIGSERQVNAWGEFSVLTQSVNKDNMSIYWNSSLESLRMCVLANLHWGIDGISAEENREREKKGGKQRWESGPISHPWEMLYLVTNMGVLGELRCWRLMAQVKGPHACTYIKFRWNCGGIQRVTGINRPKRKSSLNQSQAHETSAQKLNESEQGRAERMDSPLTWKHFVERDYGCWVQCECSPQGPSFILFSIPLPSSSSH